MPTLNHLKNAGCFAVMSELCFRGYNVSRIESGRFDSLLVHNPNTECELRVMVIPLRRVNRNNLHANSSSMYESMMRANEFQGLNQHINYVFMVFREGFADWKYIIVKKDEFSDFQNRIEEERLARLPAFANENRVARDPDSQMRRITLHVRDDEGEISVKMSRMDMYQYFNDWCSFPDVP
jgi:hypothetical protein